MQARALPRATCPHTSTRRLRFCPRASLGACATQLAEGPAASTSTNGNWAIVKVSGTNQWVEVGRSLAVKSTQLGEATLGKLVRFKDVLAFKDQRGSLLKKGKPYLSGVIVEGVVSDQFLGPAAGGPASPAHLPLSKVVITKIQLDEAGQQQQHAQQQEGEVLAV